MPNALYYRRRDTLEITLFAIYRRTGFQVAYLSDIERGTIQPKLEDLEKLAEIYQVTESELRRITGIERTTQP